MIAIEIREPGEPDVLVPVERPTPVAGPGEVLIKVARRRRQPARRHAAARHAIRRRPARPTFPASRSRARSRRSAPDVTRLARRRRGLRARRRRRLRRVLRRAGAAVSAGAARARSRSPPRRFPKRSSPSGPTSSSADGCRPASRSSIHGGSSGIGTTAIQLARARRRARVRDRRVGRQVRGLRAARRRARASTIARRISSRRSAS